ncbi:MAG: hypothetical protein Q8Q57_08860 [Methylotenera sp.]|nr:hypothetical protein [Methylotenera sp.]
MTDIEYLNNKSQYFRESLRKNMNEATGPKKTDVDVIRTAIWYEFVRQKLSAHTPYEVERILEPDAFGYTEDAEPYHKNKWTKYKVGKFTPYSALIAKVEYQLPGTKYLLNHFLWECLKADINKEVDIKLLLKELSPEIQQVIFEHNLTQVDCSIHRIKYSDIQLKMLERRAGLEALTCLMILFREAYAEKNHKKTLNIGISLYRVLLIVCNTLPFKHFTMELFYIFDKRVFSQIDANGLGFRFDEFSFVDAVELLNELLLAIEDGGQSTNGLETMIKLINGEHGFDIMSALRAPIGPILAKTEYNLKDYQNYERQERLRTWANMNIYSVNREHLPPISLG